MNKHAYFLVAKYAMSASVLVFSDNSWTEWLSWHLICTSVSHCITLNTYIIYWRQRKHQKNINKHC